ncbi:hypothetical protein [Hyphomicrobium sp. LHD-15]|uniref:hypothetical protein n=1 Tax=Hyphomicrobium sp. LHD-15 TaxID=3072142 RepID=UPI00280DFB20|nr:hypothetical protein [Hyphomicrobium sp. LHD-15]MDQ8697140.1 hypothetical protein [Hyphomicrobium sp. LHD-15]
MPQKFDLSFDQGSLARRGAITLAALLAYCVGSWIVLPGIDASALIGPASPSGLASKIGRLSILALGIVPMLSALVLVEIAQMACPPLRRWAGATASNGRSLDGWVIVLTLAIAGYQANGVAVALEGIGALVPTPGLAFRAGVIGTLVAGSAFVVWLTSLVTRHGLGSGFLLLLAAPLLMALPSLLPSQILAWGDESQLTIPLTLAAFLAAASAVVAAARISAQPDGKGQLLWPVLIAYTLAPWLLVPLLPQFSSEAFLNALEAMKPGQPWRVAILPALTLVFYFLRARSLAQASSTPDEGVRWLPALLVAFAVVVSELIMVWLPAPLALDGRNVVVLVLFALAIIEGLGLRHSSAAA